MNLKLFTTVALLAVSTSALALEDVIVDIQPNETVTSEYGRRLPSGDPRTGSVQYNIELESPWSVIVYARIYDNDFSGNYYNPGEVEISISGFTPQSSGSMRNGGDEYQNYQISGILSPGPQKIVVKNIKNTGWIWGVNDLQVELIEQVPEPSQFTPYIPIQFNPYIPEPPIQPTPSAATLKVRNHCDVRFSDDWFVQSYPDTDLSILEYARLIQDETLDYATADDTERFLDYIHYVERMTGKSFLRQSIGTNEYNLEMTLALMEIPGEQSEFGESPYVWCPASCPIGYTQTAIQCETSFTTTEGFMSTFIDEGFDSYNVCGFDTGTGGNRFSESDQLAIRTSLTCTRDVEIIEYRDVQGTPDWPIKN